MLCVLIVNSGKFCCRVTGVWVIPTASTANDQQLPSHVPATCFQSSQERSAASWRPREQRLQGSACHWAPLWTRSNSWLSR